MKHYIGIAGTNATHSTNRQLIEYMSRHFSDTATITVADIAGWPLFAKNPDHTVPEAATALAAQIQAADGVIIATPEYDHSVPAVLSSALAWLSYYIHPFAGKPVMILGASYGALGTSRAQAQLRQILESPELDARILPQGEFLLGHSLQAFSEQGDLKDDAAVTHLTELMGNLAIFTDINAQLTNSLRAHHEEAQS